MVVKIQRWHPIYSCLCVAEQEVEYDDAGNVKTPAQFLLMNYVCDRHKHMASTTIPDNELHMKMAMHVLDLIEQAKTMNINQVDGLIAKATRILDKFDLLGCRHQVLIHNLRLDVEWQELVTFAWAFDAHIYEQLMLEDKLLQQRRKKQIMILASGGVV